MRPIDADKLIQEIKGKNIPIVYESPVYGDLPNLIESAMNIYKGMVIDTIKNQPTAYDVDKVVEKLQKKAIPVVDEDEHIVPESNVHETYELEMVTLSDAIEIVKSGGIEK